MVWWLGCQTPSGESSGLKPWIGIGIEKVKRKLTREVNPDKMGEQGTYSGLTSWSGVATILQVAGW